MNLLLAYRLGTLIEYLANQLDRPSIVKTRRAMEYIPILNVFREIKDILEDFRIEGVIEEKVDYWIRKLGRDYKTDQSLLPEDSEVLVVDAKLFDELLTNEILYHLMLGISYDGGLTIDDLLLTSEGRSSNFFRSEIWRKLPEMAKSDISQGATCLLAGAYTAAAMVCLRGMEEIIREYYAQQIGDPKRKGLFKLIEELRNLKTTNKNLLGYLNFIRSDKRNMAAHPNKIFNQEEAERIFMHITAAIPDIYSDMQN